VASYDIDFAGLPPLQFLVQHTGAGRRSPAAGQGLGLASGRGAGPGLDPVPQRLVVHGEQRVEGEGQCGPQVVAQR
jgi:hypothetical protein